MTMRYTNPRLLYFTLQVLFASAAYSAPEASVFASSVAASVPSSVCLMPNLFLSLRVKCVGGNCYHEQIK